MKAAIVTPYLDTLGGGERYMLSAAKALSEEGWTVHVETKNGELISKAAKRFDMELSKLKAVESVSRGDGYDVCIWLSDGSIPLLSARKNFLHFQQPFVNVDGKSLMNRMKFFRIDKIIVNSKYTKNFIDKEYPKESVVLYPPVTIDKFKPSKKINSICYVGRFSRLAQAKRQDILIEAFRKLYRKGYKQWSLKLVGSSDVGRDDLINELLKSSSNLPIEIMENASFSTLAKTLSESTFFWSASGFGVDPDITPEKMEHFGMTVVEAMSAGTIPLIFDGGGHSEIVDEGENGFKWKDIDALVTKTENLIEDSVLQKEVAKNALARSEDFSYKEFKKKLISLV